jgi:hypothetical protein
MGAADDIKNGLTKGLATFTKQRKAEEKQSSSAHWRRQRMMEVRGEFLTEASDAIMEECYMKASDNNTLPATARQVFYVARPLLQRRTEKEVKYSYFSQTLLPDFVKNHKDKTADWDVVYDDRGHFNEPHTGRVVGLGTLNVRAYLSRITPLKLEEAGFNPAGVETYGPSGNFGAVLYVEKEGFMPLFKRVKLAERFDISVMSSKGMSVIAARQLAEGVCSKFGIPLVILHDFDRPGIIIRDTLENDTKRFSYGKAPRVIDIGLSLEDIDGLDEEDFDSKISDERLEQAGVGQASINFLDGKRVELNAMTARQLVDFVERKLKQHRIGKVVPSEQTLVETYETFVRSDRLEELFNNAKEELENDDAENPIEVPKNLTAQVKKKLKEQPAITWHRALELIINPAAAVKERNKVEGEDEDIEDEDLGDIDE